MNRIVLLRKGIHESIKPAIVVQQTKTCSYQTVVPQECAFLRAALNQHVDELFFTTLGNFNAGQLVCALFKSGTGHDGQINSTAQMHQISIREVLNNLRWFAGYYGR